MITKILYLGRQGAQGRTHLMSPVMAAAAALNGKLTDVRKVSEWSPTSGRNSTKLDIAPDIVEFESDDEIVEIEIDDEIERIEDLPKDGQQTGIESTNVPSPGTGMVPFTQLRGIGKLTVVQLYKHRTHFA